MGWREKNTATACTCRYMFYRIFDAESILSSDSPTINDKCPPDEAPCYSEVIPINMVAGLNYTG